MLAEVALSPPRHFATFAQRRAACVLLALGLLSVGSAGCAGRSLSTAARAPAPRAANHVLFFADGAGNYQNGSRNLQEAAAEVGQPVNVITFAWNQGKGRYLQDHADFGNIRAEGSQLAALMEAYRRAHQDEPIYLVGYSAGCGVVLAALEQAPPQSVERVILLSPSLSSCYDLRPSLPAVKAPLHVHYSERDWLWMGLATSVVGSTDRRWGPTAARYGFRTCDADVAARVWQRPWQPSDRCDDNYGGHFGIYGHEFLRRHVLAFLP